MLHDPTKAARSLSCNVGGITASLSLFCDDTGCCDILLVRGADVSCCLSMRFLLIWLKNESISRAVACRHSCPSYLIYHI